ncbi:Kinesin-like protein KIN12B [Acorus calamus]|uniref:Kinesin-like protein KIN12B n=1 Tax=Acorus calamus TaxID=4465 RepID=A0AAV9CYL2_ACOCL|nr:Kinesin-like protein KIN12B [Acorus calamus]
MTRFTHLDRDLAWDPALRGGGGALRVLLPETEILASAAENRIGEHRSELRSLLQVSVPPPPSKSAGKGRSPLPPRPPLPSNSNPLKRKLNMETLDSSQTCADGGAQAALDSGVKVIVRMRPPNKDEEEGEQIVQKISLNSLSMLDHTFTFDSVADTGSTQQDIFQLVGMPLVENCLAGFNSSIFAYGQTGSGKTYTMWGPQNALSEEDSTSAEKGLTPRVFERLFARIHEEQVKHADKQLSYQCRCSFLEIYNEQITDLLDPNQRNLQIREDVKSGVYVDNLTEEYVCTIKDVTELLLKSMTDGLSSLRTSRINLVDLAGSERQKLTAAAGDRLKEAGNINRSLSQLGNLINILAEVSQSGKQRHIPYRDSRLTFLLQESLGGNAKLVMICAVSPALSCKNETFSTLRFAQRAKAIKNKAVVNEISQDDVNVLREQIRQLKDELIRMKSNGTTVDINGGYSTGWTARRSLNLLRMSLSRPTALPTINDDSDEEMEIDEEAVEKPYIHEIQQSDSCKGINDIMKKNDQLDLEPQEAHGISGNLKAAEPCGCNMETASEGLLAKNSAINCSAIEVADVSMVNSVPEKMPFSDQCGKHVVGCELEEMSSSVNVLCSPDLNMPDAHNHRGNNGGTNMIVTETKPNAGEYTNTKNFDVEYLEEANKEKFLDLSECKTMEKNPPQCHLESVGRNSAETSVADHPVYSSVSGPNSIIPSSLSIVPCQSSPVLSTPTPSVSPIFGSCSRKSLKTSLAVSASQNDISKTIKIDPEIINLSFAQSFSSPKSPTPTSNNNLPPAEHLAASLYQGLHIISCHQQSSPLRRSSFRFSLKPGEVKPLLSPVKVDVGVQTLNQEPDITEDENVFICCYCKNKSPPLEYKEVGDNAELQLVPVNVMQSADKTKNQVPKAVEKVLAGAIRREMTLQDYCSKQAAEIAKLNRLVQQYKHERECNAIIEQTREDKISRLESLMDGVLPTEDFMEDEFLALANEHKLLKEKFENHPEVLRADIELKRVQDELDAYRNFFDMGERDVLLEEIQDLKGQLQYYIDSCPQSSRKRSSLLKLTHSGEPVSVPTLCAIPESTEGSAEDKFEQERIRWTEIESNWITISEELRVELEATHSSAEKLKFELETEKRCTEELKEALQTAMQGHARILDQYADLQEKHIALLSRHRDITDGIENVKRAAAKAGVKGAESKFINSLAAEISALRVEREKERKYWRDEKKGLQSQLKDTAEAVQAAGELLVRLKEAEEAAAIAQKRATEAYQQIDELKRKHELEITTRNHLLGESRLPKEAIRPTVYSASDAVRYDGGDSLSDDQRWKEEFKSFYTAGDESSGQADPSSWFSGYDRCNI